MRALVLGGTRFFGRSLVEDLIRKNWDITILSRGQTQVEFSGPVTNLKGDRTDPRSMSLALRQQSPFDCVFDQICYSPNDAEGAIETLKNVTRRYVFTSTVSVYEPQPDLTETMFNPNTMTLQSGGRESFDYQTGKQLAEATFAQKAPFPTVFARIPLVLGPDDHTGRLDWHIERIRKKKAIYFPVANGSIPVIHQFDAGSLLASLATQDLVGPVNLGAPSALRLDKLIASIEWICGKKAVFGGDPKQDHSPYGTLGRFEINTKKAESFGLVARDFDSWLPPLIEERYSRLLDSSL